MEETGRKMRERSEENRGEDNEKIMKEREGEREDGGVSPAVCFNSWNREVGRGGGCRSRREKCEVREEEEKKGERRRKRERERDPEGETGRNKQAGTGEEGGGGGGGSRKRFRTKGGWRGGSGRV